ncbi:MAG: hypothetical protein B7X60_01445 [Polynucleobacter sp. 39-45-136]|jgi:hypothetical protein|nr:MAG: hypothetical protein B7X60_01445 [Polynucleobacter sp. 39-45-136]
MWNEKNINSILAVLTITFIVVSGVSIQKGYLTETRSHMSMDEDDSDRNENSTPRSFVLPATPAVAEEQERKKAEILKGIRADKCMSKLKDLGYPIDDFDTSFNAKLVEAILSYQSKSKLNKTGQLDIETRKKLGCN